MNKLQLGRQICNVIHICSCNRNTDRMFKPLKVLLEKLIAHSTEGAEDKWYLKPDDCTDEELLLIALLDQRADFITHGINIEYPIAMIDECKQLLELINNYEKAEL